MKEKLKKAKRIYKYRMSLDRPLISTKDIKEYYNSRRNLSIFNKEISPDVPLVISITSRSDEEEIVNIESSSVRRSNNRSEEEQDTTVVEEPQRLNENDMAVFDTYYDLHPEDRLAYSSFASSSTQRGVSSSSSSSAMQVINIGSPVTSSNNRTHLDFLQSFIPNNLLEPSSPTATIREDEDIIIIGGDNLAQDASADVSETFDRARELQQPEIDAFFNCSDEFTCSVDSDYATNDAKLFKAFDTANLITQKADFANSQYAADYIRIFCIKKFNELQNKGVKINLVRIIIEAGF